MRAVCYSRVSSAGQAERGTIESQFRDLPAFIKRQGWTLVRPVGTYVDDGHTAKAGYLAARTGFSALARDAAAGLFDAVAIVDMDRLTRSEDLAERGAILGVFQRARVKIAIANTGQVLDLSSSIGDLLSLMGGFGAAEENRKRSSRAVAGRKLSISRGRLPAGKTPYGLAFCPTAGWSIHPVNGPIAREILKRLADGETSGAIASDFRERGLPLPQKGTWTAGRVWNIATRKHHTGTWIADVERGTAVSIPAITTEEMWQRAQGGLLDRRNKGRKTKHSYLLEKIATCEKCGAMVRIATNAKRKWSRYTCRIARNNGMGNCDASYLVEGVDERVWDAISRELADPQLAERIAAGAAATAGDAAAWRRDAAECRRKIARLEKEVEPSLLARYRRGTISQAALDRELAELGKERRQLQRQLQAASIAIGRAGAAEMALGDVAATLDLIRAGLSATTPEERAQLVRSLVEPGGIILGDTIRMKLRIPAPGERGGTSSLASGSACRIDTKKCVELRVVA